MSGAAGRLVHIPGGTPQAVALLPDQTSIVSLPRRVGRLSQVPEVLGYYRTGRGGAIHESLT